MPKFLEEIQLKPLSSVPPPREGISLYNDGGVLTLVHSNGKVDRITSQGDGGSIDLSNYATIFYVDSKVEEALENLDLGDINLGDYALKTELPTLTSQLTNDSGFITDSALTTYALKTDLPTKLSELTNDSGYLTEHQSLEGYATELYVDGKVSGLVNAAPGALDTLKELAQALGDDPNFATTIATNLSSKVDKTTSANRVYGTDSTGSQKLFVVSNTAANETIPLRLSNGRLKVGNAVDAEDAVTLYQMNLALSTKAEKSEVPTRTSQLQNDSGYLTQHQSLENYATKSFVDTKVSALIGAAPDALNTLEELAVAVRQNDSLVGTLNTAIGNKANSSDVYTKTQTYTKTEVDGLISGIKPTVDLSNYYNKTETNNAINTEVQKIIGAAPQAYDTLKEISDYIESDLSNTSAMLADIAKKANSSDVYSKSEANGKFALISDIPEAVDMTKYYTKTETDAIIDDKLSGLEGIELNNYYTKTEVDTKVLNLQTYKQDTLVSGTNIKTINGQSILGSGDIEINAGYGAVFRDWTV